MPNTQSQISINTTDKEDTAGLLTPTAVLVRRDPHILRRTPSRISTQRRAMDEFSKVGSASDGSEQRLRGSKSMVDLSARRHLEMRGSGSESYGGSTVMVPSKKKSNPVKLQLQNMNDLFSITNPTHYRRNTTEPAAAGLESRPLSPECVVNQGGKFADPSMSLLDMDNVLLEIDTFSPITTSHISEKPLERQQKSPAPKANPAARTSKSIIDFSRVHRLPSLAESIPSDARINEWRPPNTPSGNITSLSSMSTLVGSPVSWIKPSYSSSYEMSSASSSTPQRSASGGLRKIRSIADLAAKGDLNAAKDPIWYWGE